MNVSLTYIDTACLLLDINGFKIITDPALDAKTGLFPKLVGKPFIFSKKTLNPSLLSLSNSIDLALVSHDHHGDNLDATGKELLKRVPKIISTVGAQRRLEKLNVTGLKPWESLLIDTPLLPGLKITAVPAQHTNIKRLNYIVGHVIGFIIEWNDQEDGALYISGDTVLFEGIYEIAAKFKINTAILHLGAGAFPYLKPNLRVTMNATEAIEVADILKCKQVIPIHYEGWWHFREPVKQMKDKLFKSSISNKLVWLERGIAKELKL